MGPEEEAPLHLLPQGAFQPKALPSEPEGVPHVPRRVVFGDVQGVKVEELALHLGALHRLVAQGAEDLHELPLHEGDGVEPPGEEACSGKAHVHPLPLQGLLEGRLLQGLFPRLQGRLRGRP